MAEQMPTDALFRHWITGNESTIFSPEEVV